MTQNDLKHIVTQLLKKKTNENSVWTLRHIITIVYKKTNYFPLERELLNIINDEPNIIKRIFENNNVGYYYKESFHTDERYSKLRNKHYAILNYLKDNNYKQNVSSTTFKTIQNYLKDLYGSITYNQLLNYLDDLVGLNLVGIKVMAGHTSWYLKENLNRKGFNQIDKQLVLEVIKKEPKQWYSLKYLSKRLISKEIYLSNSLIQSILDILVQENKINIVVTSLNKYYTLDVIKQSSKVFIIRSKSKQLDKPVKL